MKRTVFLIFWIIQLNVKAQFTDKFYHLDAYARESNFDSLIRAEVNGNLSESYYLITYPVLAGATSWVPQFIRIFNKIKNTKNDIIILYYLNGGLREKDIPLFMREKLKLTDSEIGRIKVIFNDDLYNTISNGRNLVRLQYFFRRKLFYDEAGKWHDVASSYLPEEKINIKLTHKIPLKGIDSLLLFERDQVFPFDDDKLIILSDAKNEILELDINSGVVKPIISITKLYSATDLYCKYFSNGDSSACNYAKALEHKVTSIGRQTLKIDGLKKVDNYLYLFGGIEAFVQDKKDYTFKNEEGQSITIAATEPSTSYFSLVFKYNLNTKHFEVYKLEELPETKKSFPFIYPDCGFIMKHDTIIAGMNTWHKKGPNTLSLINLVLTNGTYKPASKLEPKEIKSPFLADNFNKSFFYTFNQQQYFSVNFSKNIYLVGRENPQSTFYGNGSAPYVVEKVPEFVEDTSTTLEMNFSIHDIKPILDNNYLLTYCDYKGQPIFELKNRMLKTVDIIDAKSIKGFERYYSNSFRVDLLINQDKIFYKSIENGEMYLNVFSITKAH